MAEDRDETIRAIVEAARATKPPERTPNVGRLRDALANVAARKAAADEVRAEANADMRVLARQANKLGMSSAEIAFHCESDEPTILSFLTRDPGR